MPQELTRIEYGLRTGSLFRSERWTRFADSAPTVLRMRGLLVPPDMTADNLVVARPPWETGSR